MMDKTTFLWKMYMFLHERHIVKIVMTDVYRIKYVLKKILNFEIHEFSFF